MTKGTTPPGVSPARWTTMKKVLRVIQDWPTQHPSVTHLATKTKLSPRTVQYVLRDAERAGLVKISYSTGRGLANCYEVLVRGPERVQGKGATLHPLRIPSGYSLRTSGRSAVGASLQSTATAAAVLGLSTITTPGTEPQQSMLPWWIEEKRLPHVDEEWPRHGNGLRLNLFDGYCVLCRKKVLRLMGWLDEDGKARHDPGAPNQKHLCRYYEGGRSGESVRTAGDIGESVARAHRVRGH